MLFTFNVEYFHTISLFPQSFFDLSLCTIRINCCLEYCRAIYLPPAPFALTLCLGILNAWKMSRCLLLTRYNFSFAYQALTVGYDCSF